MKDVDDDPQVYRVDRVETLDCPPSRLTLGEIKPAPRNQRLMQKSTKLAA